jgi:hypothetical protein
VITSRSIEPGINHENLEEDMINKEVCKSLKRLELFSKDEDQKILKMGALYNKDWSKIA